MLGEGIELPTPPGPWSENRRSISHIVSGGRLAIQLPGSTHAPSSCGGIKTKDLTKSVELITDFIQEGVVPESIPRFIKASPIVEDSTELELVPGVHLENMGITL